MKRLEEIRKGNFPEDGQKLLAESRQLGEAKDSFMLADILPFRMFCETRYGQKECYQDIISQFRQVKDRDYERMFQGACQGKKAECLELACFLTACADTLEFTSMEIYEHYRYLADLIKMTARQLRKAGFFQKEQMEKLDSDKAEQFRKAILKSCRLRALSGEKYEKFFR